MEGLNIAYCINSIQSKATLVYDCIWYMAFCLHLCRAKTNSGQTAVTAYCVAMQLQQHSWDGYNGDYIKFVFPGFPTEKKIIRSFSQKS